jgi:hypothetical protein
MLAEHFGHFRALPEEPSGAFSRAPQVVHLTAMGMNTSAAEQ